MSKKSLDMFRPIILDTDWWTDCDDCVAVRVLANAERRGKIKLIGANINAFMDISAYSLDLFLKESGLYETEVAIDYNSNDFKDMPKDSYQKKIVEVFGDNNDFKKKTYSSSVEFYRRLLSSSENKIDIISVGFQNSLADLLKSEADLYSPLNGADLVAEKVGKLWAMAGKWDVDYGREYNIVNNARTASSAKYICENWPGEITYLGFEIGESVITGGDEILKDENDVLRIAMDAHGSSEGRCSWDPMTALIAVIGDEKEAGYSVVKGKAIIDNDGSNHFISDINGKHCYVKKKYDDNFYSTSINSCIIY